MAPEPPPGKPVAKTPKTTAEPPARTAKTRAKAKTKPTAKKSTRATAKKPDHPVPKKTEHIPAKTSGAPSSFVHNALATLANMQKRP
jgi:hypothetical protein